MNGALVFDGVRKRYRRGPWVLDGIDLAIEPRSVTLVVGANGSGKSTLLRIATGLYRATSGQVRCRPDSVAFAPERLAAQVRLTAGSYVAHMGRLRGLPPALVAARSAELFARLGLSPGPAMAVRSLSKGNAQKVILTQAFLASVGLVVLDEPFAGLDAGARATAWELIGEARDGAASVVLSAHVADDADRTDQAVVLEAGRLGPVTAAATPPSRIRIRLAGAGPVSSLTALPGVAIEATAPQPRGTGATADQPPGTGSPPPGTTTGVPPPGAEGALTLTVDASLADATLARALAEGWSVRSVNPVPGTGVPQ